MLTNIENRLEELFEQIEMMPPEKVELAEKVNFSLWEHPGRSYSLQVVILSVGEGERTTYATKGRETRSTEVTSRGKSKTGFRKGQSWPQEKGNLLITFILYDHYMRAGSSLDQEFKRDHYKLQLELNAFHLDWS